jgi:chromosome segregation protein
MRLKSLTLDGFKSFAQKTTIEFHPGLTAIVGPNGSGKSNLIEAIRWVLGEQSAKSLRGSKMPDVIFAGSTVQPALNRAEVGITFDNHDHFLALDLDEVTIDRRIYRDGDSEYLLNNKNVRLKDITDLLLDTGLGRDSFSIISQGKIEQIFSSKPADRRQVIEEAAGILKYKQERISAQIKLAETQDHLLRVADIISELSKQREPLKKQASLAHDYLEQKNRLAFFDKSRLIYELEHAAQTKQQAETELKKTQAAVLHYQQQVKLQTSQQKQLQQQQKQQLGSLGRLQNELVKNVKQREYLLGRQQLSAQEKNYRLQKQRELTEQLKIDRQESRTLEKQLLQKKQQLAAESKRLVAVQQQLVTFQQQLSLNSTDLQAQIEELRNQIITEMQQQASLNNQSRYLKKAAQRQTQGHQLLQQNLVGIKQQLATKKDELQQAKTSLKQIEQNKIAVNESLQELMQQQKQLETATDEQRDKWYQAAGIYQQTKAKYESLHELTSKYNNYYHGVKEVLLAKQQLPGIVGSVAELIQVPEKLSLAIETVLASQLQNVIVTNEQAAKTAIAFLKEHHFGRVTFLPQTTIKPRQLNHQLQLQLAKLTGVIGVASQLVLISPENKNILAHLLGTTIIVKKLDDALKVAKKLNFSCRIVSLAGDVVNAGGAISGGSVKRVNGLLSEQQQLDKLKKVLLQMKQQLEQLEKTGIQFKQRQQEKNGQIADLQQQLTALREKLQQATAAYQLQQNEHQHLEKQLKAQQFEIQQSNLTAENFLSDQKKVTDKQQQLLQAVATDRQKFKALKQQLTDFAANRQQQQTKLADLKQQQAVAQVQQKNLLQQQADLQTRLDLKIKTITSKKTALEKINEQNQLKTDQQQAVDLQKLKVQHQQLADQLKQQKTDQQEIEQQQTKIQESLSRQGELLRIQQTDQQQAAYKVKEINHQIDQALNDLAQKYQLTYEAAARKEHETNFAVIKRQLKLLQQGISELGSVNLGAIDEYQRVDKRYQFLADQRSDLDEAKTELQKSMEEIDRQVELRFKKTFEQTATAFSQIFPEMFGGGQASLRLTQPDDLLQTGVEIMAQPPGKKLQRLSLLSGGEKALTAIVLLFAILKVKPVPFVILDEAEAALDDANVDRYAQYLKKFCQQSQFIVITHRKGTMDQADVLYGITMQHSGISKMVSVALS